ncbi:aromatic ring-hydroxylating oxygenase subunit alpha [Prosthecomicrobium pneumaticum]|uniref:Phenylpropionate dioxygenase-like ring-hydroxylating dioxygenase large terminal subunit n=1 Tax=Prosthecomicrobium pneumaticum TaxID=81895 RepID=A0A7W9L3Q9_9HYPH|nr:aromatic ring-hydroxylating dioxygenase subunit alpha [Prosthecomicrobium pneumaticum]MBB5754809.1 phenylpropionate dioxygenase-like ring-hydroxylating dioxygenase large terminal subunit [Prosthecomicrobium pneumaticum]
MARTTDPVALDQWYAIETLAALGTEPRRTRLLGQEIVYRRGEDGVPIVREIAADGGLGTALPVRERYECLWTTLGRPERELFPIEEAEETDRRVVVCGWVTMRASGLRIVENFLDMAHFPFVHTNILGAEPHTEVPQYKSEIRRDVDEVWATNCTFFQSRIAATESAGDFVQLTYRVPSPFVVMLYRVCPSSPNRLDAIALFIQPLEADLCRAQPVMYLVDAQSSQNELLKFEQVIFLQDRIIVENQRPLLLPLEPRAELPTRADLSSVAYRRWLKEKGLRFGTAEGAEAA